MRHKTVPRRTIQANIVEWGRTIQGAVLIKESILIGSSSKDVDDRARKGKISNKLTRPFVIFSTGWYTKLCRSGFSVLVMVCFKIFT